MILLKLKPNPNGFDAYRPTTKERGILSPDSIPPRYRKQVEEKGRAVVVVANKIWTSRTQ